MLFIIGNVAFKFLVPEIRPCFGCSRILATRVPMPETAAHLDQRAAARNDDVGMSDDAPVADAKAVAVRMEHLAHEDFRLRVARTDPAHDAAALFGRDGVHGDLSSRSADLRRETADKTTRQPQSDGGDEERRARHDQHETDLQVDQRTDRPPHGATALRRTVRLPERLHGEAPGEERATTSRHG